MILPRSTPTQTPNGAGIHGGSMREATTPGRLNWLNKAVTSRVNGLVPTIHARTSLTLITVMTVQIMSTAIITQLGLAMFGLLKT